MAGVGCWIYVLWTFWLVLEHVTRFSWKNKLFATFTTTKKKEFGLKVYTNYCKAIYTVELWITLTMFCLETTLEATKVWNDNWLVFDWIDFDQKIDCQNLGLIMIKWICCLLPPTMISAGKGNFFWRLYWRTAISFWFPTVHCKNVGMIPGSFTAVDQHWWKYNLPGNRILADLSGVGAKIWQKFCCWNISSASAGGEFYSYI